MAHKDLAFCKNLSTHAVRGRRFNSKLHWPCIDVLVFILIMMTVIASPFIMHSSNVNAYTEETAEAVKDIDEPAMKDDSDASIGDFGTEEKGYNSSNIASENPSDEYSKELESDKAPGGSYLNNSKVRAVGQPIRIVDNGQEIVSDYRQILTEISLNRYHEIDLDNRVAVRSSRLPAIGYGSYVDYSQFNANGHTYKYSDTAYIKQGNIRFNIFGLRYHYGTSSWQYREEKDGSWLTMTDSMTAFIDYYKVGASVTDYTGAEVPTVDSAALGFRIHMFKYPYSAFYPLLKPDSLHGGEDWKREWRGASTPPGIQGGTEQGLYTDVVGESGFPWVQKLWYCNQNTWNDIPPAGSFKNQPRDNNTSLKNWFDPNPATLNPLSYSNYSQVRNTNYHVGEANHLFIKSVYDDTGYLYYNSEENAAVLNSKGSDGLLDFSVYKGLVSSISEKRKNYEFFHMRGNFFPFNDIDVTKRYSWDEYDADGVNWDVSDRTYDINDNYDAYQADKGYHNTIFGLKGIQNSRVTKYANGRDIEDIDESKPGYFHGMYAYTTFNQPGGGMITKLPDGTDTSPKPMVFEFTGDDDLMVYIDGVMVLDLGGVHDAQTGSINFATGEVKYTVNGTLGNSSVQNEYSTKIKTMFEAAGNVETTTWNGDTFADNTIHKLQMFYMERGKGASNLKIKVNIPPKPEAMYSVVKKVVKTEGVEYDADEIFYMNVEFEDANGEWQPISRLRVRDAGGSHSYIRNYYIEGDEDENGDPIPHELPQNTATIGIKDGQKAYFRGIADLPVKIRTTETGSSNVSERFSDHYSTTYSPVVNGVLGDAQDDPAVVTIVPNGIGGVVVTNTPEKKMEEIELTKLELTADVVVSPDPDDPDLEIVDPGENPVLLDNVRFKLFEANSDWTLKSQNPVMVSGAAEDGTVTTDENGVIKLGVLNTTSQTKYFILEETAAKDSSYVKPADPWRLKVESDGTFKVYVKTGDGWKQTRGSEDDVFITNSRVSNLPATGGHGTHPYIFLGFFLIALALVITFSQKMAQHFKMKNCRMGMALVLITMCMLSGGVNVKAMENNVPDLDTSKELHLTVRCEKIEGTKIKGITIGICKLADLSVIDNTAVYNPVSNLPGAKEITSSMTAEQSKAIAKKCFGEVSSGDSWLETGVTDISGSVYFSNLNAGMYLVGKIEGSRRDDGYNFDSFMVTVPQPAYDDVTGKIKWIYEVKAKPKVVEDEPIKPENPVKSDDLADKPTKSDNTDDKPLSIFKTGDDTRIAVWGALMFLAAFVLILLFESERRRRGS